MRTLILWRHAKSDWSDASRSDIDRELNARGRQAAPRMASYLIRSGFQPDYVLCSTAKRTRQTLDALVPGLADDAEIQYRDTLYLGSDQAWLKACRAVPDSAQTVLCVGHIPGLHSLTVTLADPESSPELLSQVAFKFPAGAMAILSFERSWADIGQSQGVLTHFQMPKALK